MRSEHIQYFIALAKTRSITQASLELHTTHQNVSKMIRQLEEEMETQLFTRSQKGLILTESGEIMLDLAKQVTNQFEQIRGQIASLKANRALTGELHLHYALATLLSPLLHSFTNHYPQISVTLHELEPLMVLEQVIGIVPILTNPDFQDIYAPYLDQVQLISLTSDQFTCVASPNSSLAQKKNISLTEFLHYPLAFSHSVMESTALLMRILERYGTPEIRLISSNVQIYGDALLNGHYVGFSTYKMHLSKNTTTSPSSLSYIPFQEDMRFDVCLVIHQQPELTSISQAFIDFMRNTYPQIAKDDGL